MNFTVLQELIQSASVNSNIYFCFISNYFKDSTGRYSKNGKRSQITFLLLQFQHL